MNIMKSEWKQWAAGIGGVLVMVLPYLGFTLFMHKALLVVLGVIIATASFWALSESRLR